MSVFNAEHIRELAAKLQINERYIEKDWHVVQAISAIGALNASGVKRLQPLARTILEADVKRTKQKDTAGVKPHDRKAYELDLLVGDVLAVLDAAGIERAHYWCYSIGGWIGLGLLVKAPQRLRKAVLGGVHPYE